MKKTIKLGLLSFLAGEIVALFYKDEEFRQRFNNSKGFDKCKVLFSSLLDLNKRLFTDVKSVDYKSQINNIIQKFEDERKVLEEKINFLKENLNNFKKEKLESLLKDWENRINEMKSEINTKLMDIKQKYALEAKVEKLKEKIEEVKEKIYKTNS